MTLDGGGGDDLKQRLAEAKAEKKALKREIERLSQELDQADFRYRQAEAELGQARERIFAMEASLTWRLARRILDPLERMAARGGLFGRLPLKLLGKGGRDALTSGPGALDYPQWIKAFDTLDAKDRALIREHMERMRSRPLFSVVVPVYNTPEELLRACLDSVLDQLYPRWELCVADDASTAVHVRQVLEEYQAKDGRVKVAFRRENGHIAKATNSALELAEGEFVALLDHDDLLAPHALYMAAAALEENPRADVIYSDEDKIDEKGGRFGPYFKPDFNPELFLSQNFINHLGIYRRELVERAGCFRSEFTGSQDWDLALRVIELTEPARIVHLPFVLYHWRATAGSTALEATDKDYAHEAGRRAVADYLKRTGSKASVELTPDGLYNRVRHPLPDPAPRVSVIIPTRMEPKQVAWVEELLDGTDYPDFELVLVANNLPSDEARAERERVLGQGRMRVIDFEGSFNFSRIYNTAVPQTAGEIVAMVNDDVTPITKGWLREMVAQAVRPENGAIGAMLCYGNDTIQHAGIVLGIGGVAGHAFKRMAKGSDGYFSRARLAQNYSAVTAACLVLRREVFEEAGGLDENLPVAFNDVDFCIRVGKLGYRNVWTPHAELHHLESVSRGDDERPEARPRFHRELRYMQAKWTAELLTDPAFNPNLSLFSEHFHPACPPRVRRPWKNPGLNDESTVVHVDTPLTRSDSFPVRIEGWVAALAPIREVSCGGVTLELLTRFDVAMDKFEHPHVAGFKGELPREVASGEKLKIRIRLKDGEYVHRHEIA